MTRGNVALGELFHVGSSKRVLKSQWKNEGVPFYRGREITRLPTNGCVNNELFISESDYAEYAAKHGVPYPGDIVITAIGTIGNSYVVREGDRFYFKDASVLWLKKGTAVSSEFINLWLKSPQFFDQLDKGNGATVDTLTINKLKSVLVDLPPLPEQKHIVAILDEAFAGIATAVANTEKNLANARELFESHLNAVFTQKGDGWVEKKFGEIAGFSQGKQVGLQEQTKAPMAGYARFVRIVDYTQRTDDIRYVPDPGDKYHVTTDDIVMVRYGSPGLIGRGIAGVIANNLFKIAIIDRSVYEDYLSLFLMQKPIQQYLSTRGSVTMPALNFSHVRELVIKFPEISEQKKIVLLVDRYRIETQRLESIYQQKLDSLAELKQSILQKAFSGELTKAPDRALAEAGV